MHQFNEFEQIEALKHYEFVNTEIGCDFGELNELASLICKTPIALIVLSEINKYWVNSNTGVVFPENFHEHPLVQKALVTPNRILEFSNLSEDKSFKDDPFLKNNPGLIFCATVPLVAQDGSALGTLSVMDTRTRKLSEEQLKGIKILSRRIVKQIELNQNLIEQRKNHIVTYQRLYEVTSQSPDYIFTLDRNFKVTYINRVANGISGNLLNKHIANFFDAEIQEEFIQTCNTSLEKLKIIEKDFYINRPSGRRCFSIKFCPLKNKEGKADSILLIASDVSAARQIREELIKKQTILYEAQKISQTGSCEWDVQTGEAKFSDELYNILGIDKNTKLNHIRALTKRIHPDDLKRAEELTAKAIKNFSTLLFQYRIITPKGELKYIDGRGCPLVIKNNKIVTLLITLQDITEAINFDKKLFSAVVQSEEKERARMAGELHDGVCQYLAGGKLMLSTIENTLKSNAGKPDLEALANMVAYSKKSIMDALELTQQISRNLLPGGFHKKGIIQPVKEMVQLLNAAGTIHYKVNAAGNDDGLDPEISINIFRIIQEFIRNSQKYSEASQVDIVMVIHKKEIELEIKDNGIGFDLDAIETKQGLGLLSMHKRIHSIGGAFTYETAPGKGVQLKLKMGLD